MPVSVTAQSPDRDLARLRSEEVGFIFQAYYLLPELDALENVCLPARMARTPVDRPGTATGGASHTMVPIRRRRLLWALPVAVLLASAGCSSSDPGVAPRAADVVFDNVSVPTAMGTKPVFTLGDSVQNTPTLVIHDIVAGTGAQASATDQVTVQYVARSAKTKRTFDSSWDRGKPYQFTPSQLRFAAFAEGVPGMRVGGRRLVIVPAAQAFGNSPPAGSGLGAGETLVFVVDLVSIP